MSKQKFETVEQAIEEINKQAEEIKSLKAAQAEAEKASAKDIKNLEEALEEIESLSAQLDAQSQAGAPSIVTIGKKKYRLAGKKVNVPGFGTLTDAELAKNEEALKYLADKKSAILVKV